VALPHLEACKLPEHPHFFMARKQDKHILRHMPTRPNVAMTEKGAPISRLPGLPVLYPLKYNTRPAR
jgi:hypothetical protein